MKPLNKAAHRRFKDEIYGEFARVTGALSNAKRLEMVDLLAQRERTVQEVAGEMGLSVANASQHLRVLLDARLVEVRREGTYAFYRLADAAVFEAWRALRTVAEARLSEVDAVVKKYLGDRETLDALSGEELLTRVREDHVILLDVRPRAEFDAGHIPGARSVPLEDLARIADALPGGPEILAYCRGPYCVLADEAVHTLRKKGLHASRFPLGYPDWKALRLPTHEPPIQEA